MPNRKPKPSSSAPRIESASGPRVEMWPIDRPKPYERNPRRNDAAVEKVAASIREFGWDSAIVVDRDGVIIAGHTRLKAAKRLGLAEVPVIVRADLTEEQARALRLADNKAGEFAEWDEGLLGEELAALAAAEVDMAAFGFDLSAPTGTEGQTDEDAVPEPPPEPVSRRGAVYALGRHRLMCGDSTSAEDFARLMGGERADMVFIDPPYNVSIGTRNKVLNEAGKKLGMGNNKGGRVESDLDGDTFASDEEAGERLWRPAFQNLADNAKDEAAIYVTMPQGGTHMMMMMMMRGSWQVKHELMWLKSQPTFSMGRLDYDYQHEPICYGWKKSHRFFGAGSQTKSVWQFDKPNQSKLHPTMKPVALVENAILNSSGDGEIVLDAFLGSGTTVLACEKTGRVCYGMELDPHYCDVIRKRWAEFVHGEGCDWQTLAPEAEG